MEEFGDCAHASRNVRCEIKTSRRAQVYIAMHCVFPICINGFKNDQIEVLECYTQLDKYAARLHSPLVSSAAFLHFERASLMFDSGYQEEMVLYKASNIYASLVYVASSLNGPNHNISLCIFDAYIKTKTVCCC
jgi:hypothetical protein